MSDYARSGVDTNEADRALARLLLEIAPTAAFGSQSEIGIGHFAAVVRVGPLHLALTTDGVGSKLLIAQALGKYDTVGIDCVAMNVNDLLCVGAKPLAMLDYIAVERADPEVFAQIGKGLCEGARQAGVAIVGGETAQIPEMLRGAKPGSGLDLAGMAIGLVPDGGLIDGSKVQPGDALVGIASSGVHSNGLSLARQVRAAQVPLRRVRGRARHDRRRGAAHPDTDLRRPGRGARQGGHRAARARAHHRRRVPEHPPDRGARRLRDRLPAAAARHPAADPEGRRARGRRALHRVQHGRGLHGGRDRGRGRPHPRGRARDRARRVAAGPRGRRPRAQGADPAGAAWSADPSSSRASRDPLRARGDGPRDRRPRRPALHRATARSRRPSSCRSAPTPPCAR